MIKIGLAVYFILFFGIVFVAKSVIVAKSIGKNPLVLPKDDSAYGVIGFYFKLTLIGLFVYVIANAVLPNGHDYFLPIKEMESEIIQYIGVGLLVAALIWAIIAQVHIKDSWRIGIDNDMKTELVTTGLFSISRNPIFFGMMLSLAGVFLVTPNALTGLFMILGYILMQIQIRLEEEFLTKEHGQAYLAYAKKVRRLI